MFEINKANKNSTGVFYAYFVNLHIYIPGLEINTSFVISISDIRLKYWNTFNTLNVKFVGEESTNHWIFILHIHLTCFEGHLPPSSEK